MREQARQNDSAALFAGAETLGIGRRSNEDEGGSTVLTRKILAVGAILLLSTSGAMAQKMGAGARGREPGWLEVVLSWPHRIIRPAWDSDVRRPATG